MLDLHGFRLCHVTYLLFLAIYKFNTPAFCVSFVFLRKVSGLHPGAWHGETTLQAYVFINHLPSVLFSKSPAPCHTVIQPTFLHFDLKSVSCLESFNRYFKSIRENEASKPVLLILSHLSWLLVVSASFILFLFFLMCLETISLILIRISFWITGLSFGKSAFSPSEGCPHLLSHLVVSILCDPTAP